MNAHRQPSIQELDVASHRLRLFGRGLGDQNWSSTRACASTIGRKARTSTTGAARRDQKVAGRLLRRGLGQPGERANPHSRARRHQGDQRRDRRRSAADARTRPPSDMGVRLPRFPHERALHDVRQESHRFMREMRDGDPGRGDIPGRGEHNSVPCVLSGARWRARLDCARRIPHDLPRQTVGRPLRRKPWRKVRAPREHGAG